jgi:hypothetical protein
MNKNSPLLCLVFILSLQNVIHSNPTNEHVFLSEAHSPREYLLEKFKKHDVVLLGEDHAIKQNLDFVVSLIPDLYEAGIYQLGMEFGASEHQEALDRLTTGEAYDEQLARDMMYFYNVGWAYSEYIHMPRVVWEFNRSLPEGARPFRILNISYQFDWQHWDYDDPQSAMAKIFHKGPIDAYRANLIKNEIFDNEGEKLLALVGTIHAITHYTAPGSEPITDESQLPDLLGVILYHHYPERVFSVWLHSPTTNGKGQLQQPAGGRLGQLMRENDFQPIGIDLVGTELGTLEDDNMLSRGAPNFTLSDFVQGYIFLNPINAMTGCTYEAEFFEGRSWDDILKNYPTRQWSPPPENLEAYQARVRQYVDIKDRYAGVLED